MEEMQMAMNKECMNEKPRMSVDVIKIPAACVTQMYFDVQRLLEMHGELIRMYETESSLKKHHKAYLHIRDEADEMCRRDKEAMALITDHYQNPAKYMEHAICFHNRLKEFDKEIGEREGIPTFEEIMKKQADLKDAPEVLDVFGLPSGMVMMSTDTLGVMQDDMLALTVVVDRLVEAFREIEQSGWYNKGIMSTLTGEAAGLASDVFSRWDDADLAELN